MTEPEHPQPIVVDGGTREVKKALPLQDEPDTTDVPEGTRHSTDPVEGE